ncbi:cytochrome P450 6a2-like [Osmia lignaria lignaria]|uniref:cytochrome P450 6a2-like n=1 Tax=Osmia lignaria lignaria TaxID=1437193 RepID=UPI00402B701D
MLGYFEILCGIAALLFAFYYYSTANFNYWKDRGVVGPKPLPFFGNTKDLMFATVSMPEFSKDVYLKYKDERIVGLFMQRSPVIFLKDPELIKDVLIKDFSKFSDRGFKVYEKTEPLSQHLFNLETKRWRPMRSKLSPMFTSGKLRDMFGLILECSEHFKQYLDKVVAKGEPIDIPDLTGKFTTDVIGSCAFGIDTNSLADEESEFRKVGKQIFTPTLGNVLRLETSIYLPKLYELLGYIVPDKKFAPFFTKVVIDTMMYRKEHNIHRPDFINMLMELKDHPQKIDDIKLTDYFITAQAFVFFAAGFETSSTTMSNALYELAQNHDIQDRLRKEIEKHFENSDGNFKYEQIKEMEYLDKVFKETLRKYPPGALLPRKATSDYTFDGTKASISKGMSVWIPIFAIHRDPEIYPNPEVFDPERFNEDVVDARHPMSYLPFGDGPRNCIGARFAVYQTKLGLITILRNYKVDICEKTVIPYHFTPGAFILTPQEGIYLKITKLTS